MPPRRNQKIYNTAYYKKLLEEEKKKHKKPGEDAKKKNLAKEILVRILETAGAYDESLPDLRSCQSAYLAGGYGLVAEIEDAKERKYLKSELHRLKKQRFLEEKRRGERLELCLTEKGKKAALRHQISNCDDILKDKYYVVIFDIPETERRIRQFFRLFLKEADFVQLQKSVWATQKNVLESLKELIHDANAGKWVHIITAIDITDFFDKD